MTKPAIFEPLDFDRLNSTEQQRRSDELLQRMLKRRSVRHFSSAPVPISLIENAIRVGRHRPVRRQPAALDFRAHQRSNTKAEDSAGGRSRRKGKL